MAAVNTPRVSEGQACHTRHEVKLIPEVLTASRLLSFYNNKRAVSVTLFQSPDDSFGQDSSSGGI